MASKQPAAKDEGPVLSEAEGFEALYRRLEENVSKLEQGGLTIEESLVLYEEGMDLARRCQELLQNAELRINRLQESFANGLTAMREPPAEYAPDSEAEPAKDELPLE